MQQKTATQWEGILQQAGVPCARLRTLPEALESEQVQQRGFVQTLADGTKVPTLPFRIGEISAYKPSGNAPKLGEDNARFEEILARMPIRDD